MRRLSAILLLMVVSTFVGGCGSSSEQEPDQAALDVVESAYESFNNGDMDAWVEIRNRGSQFGTEQEREDALDRMRHSVGAQIDAGARYTGITCESRGFGEWPVADAGSVSGYYFTCDTTRVTGSAEIAEAFEWVVDGGKVIAVRSDG